MTTDPINVLSLFDGISGGIEIKKLKICNLYAGIGGNRKLWPENIDVTAIELNPEIAAIYSDFFPDDEVIITDAHQYLLEHYDDGWDFIWASPPCPSHSTIREMGVKIGQYGALYPDMGLYQEMILLRHFFKNPFCVENVKPYYEPLISPQIYGRHCFWTNFPIGYKSNDWKEKLEHGTIEHWQKLKGFDISGYKTKERKSKILRNTVRPELGKYIFDCAFKTQKRWW